MSTMLAQVHSGVCNLVLGSRIRGGLADVLLLFEELEQQTQGKNEYPKENIYHPPPPANNKPPKTAVTLLAVDGLCFRFGFTAPVFLVDLGLYIGTTANGTPQGRRINFRLAQLLHLAAAVRAKYGIVADLFSAILAIHNIPLSLRALIGHDL